MRLDYQNPVGGDVGKANVADVSGFQIVEFGPNEALIWASVSRQGNLPVLFVNMIAQDVPETWAFLLNDGYTRTINSKNQPIVWNGFFYPKISFRLVIETGRIREQWEVGQARYHYQAAIVRGK